MAPVKRPAWLLTTRLRAAMAVGLAAFLFALSIRDELHRSRVKPLWPLFGGLVHGWLAIAVNVAFYGYFCWLAYSFIYRSKGWERVFFAGWFGPFLLSPLKVLHPEWAAPVRHLETFGTALSLLVALSFLVNAPPGQLNVRDPMG
ncbi:MAG: hypothetical protein ACRD8A_07075 [Candidatus Acidiferrales bacterium]